MISKEQKQKFYDSGNTLPKCINIGCNNNVSVRNWGNWSFKTECNRCIRLRVKKIIQDNIVFHKKQYCENIDGHLGFRCPVPNQSDWEHFQSGLDLDHLDGNHNNNEPHNVKTYCKLCHTRKGIIKGDVISKKNGTRSFNEALIL